MRHRKFYFYIISLPLLATFLFADRLLLLGVNNPLFGIAIEYYFARKMVDIPDPRIFIWSNYFNNLDVVKVFFGANVHTDPWPDGAIYAYNYHNIFIHLHLQTGVFLIVFCILICSALVKFCRTNKLFFVLLLAICLRGMTDTFLFFESWDFIIYFFIYQFMRNSYLSIKFDKRRSESRSDLTSLLKPVNRIL